MVTATVSTNLRKRKKTDEMADSPPKRVTRARAAKIIEDSEAAPRSTRIKAASARIADEAKKSTVARTSRTSKREMPVDGKEEDLAPNEEEVKDNIETVEPVKTRGRPKKIAEPSKRSAAAAAAPTTRARRNKAIEDEAQPVLPTAKSKTRSQKAVEAKEVGNGPALKEADRASEPAKKSTGARAITVAARPPATFASKPTRARKKVAFEEPSEQDKENMPFAAQDKKPPTRGTGMRAKPIRKPPVRGSTRGNVAAKAITKNEDAVPKPLSPKKVTQVAKSNSTSSEDELCEKSPAKSLMKSPVKLASSVRDPLNSTRELSPCSPTRNLPPTKEATETILTSPAKRPPPSPFKDALKESPKKFTIDKPLSSSAIEDEENTIPFLKDSLRQSPKRINILPSQPTLTVTSHTSFKTSLLGSPARRPMSALKARTFGSPSKAVLALPPVDGGTPSKENDIFKLSAAKSQTISGSPVRRAPTQSHPTPDQKLATMDLGEEDVAEPVFVTTHDNPEEVNIGGPVSIPSTPPSVPKENSTRNVFGDVQLFRSALMESESESEDELQSGNLTMSSPSRGSRHHHHGFITDATPATQISKTPSGMLRTNDLPGRGVTDFSMTPLALQFNAWLAPSPVKNGDEIVSPPRGMFAHIGSSSKKGGAQSSRQSLSSLAGQNFFEDQMAVQDIEAVQVLEDKDLHETCDATMADAEDELRASQNSEQYGDENVVSTDPPMLFSTAQPLLAGATTITPAKVFQSNPRVIHTVSKVPLRAAAEDSPLKIPRKRCKSVSGPLTEIDELPMPIAPRSTSLMSYTVQEKEEAGVVEQSTPGRRTSSGRRSISMPMTPSNDTWSGIETPFRTVRKGADAQILRGAVVFVDVHTTEGADASGIFVELLSQMGARCVKQWTWNPRASLGPSAQTPSNYQATPSGKVGITHVVYKDGGKRTLQKVRESKGLVLCVGVGWVLE